MQIGGGGDHRCESSHQYGNHSYNRNGHPGGGDRTAGAGCRVGNTDYRDAVGGTGSGGCGFFNGWEYRSHGGNGATGRISIAIPRIFTEANHHTFTPLYY